MCGQALSETATWGGVPPLLPVPFTPPTPYVRLLKYLPPRLPQRVYYTATFIRQSSLDVLYPSAPVHLWPATTSTRPLPVHHRLATSTSIARDQTTTGVIIHSPLGVAQIRKTRHKATVGRKKFVRLCNGDCRLTWCCDQSDQLLPSAAASCSGER